MTLPLRFFPLAIGVIALSRLASAPALGTENPPGQPLGLRYDKPAAQWIEALPVGNGRQGAMTFGGVATDRVAMNDITVWSGGPQPDANRTDGYMHLGEIRKAIREGRYDAAEKLSGQFLTCRVNDDVNKYQTLGDLAFSFRLPAGTTTDYRHWLDLGQAIAGGEFRHGGPTFRRELFCSAPDKVLGQCLTSSTRGAVSFDLELGRTEKAQTRFVAPDMLVMTGNTEAVVLLTAHTSSVIDYAKGYRGTDPDPAQMQTTAAQGFACLQAARLADYSPLFFRVSLDLGSSAAAKRPTDERLRAYATEKPISPSPPCFSNTGVISSSPAAGRTAPSPRIWRVCGPTA